MEPSVMIKPRRSGKAFVDHVRKLSLQQERLHLWWLGQSGFLIQWNGTHILLDPYLSDSLTEKYSGSETPHVRMTERIVDPSLLDFVQVVTSSHAHTDHLDGETLRSLRQVNPELTIIVPRAHLELAAERVQCDPADLDGINAGETLGLGEITLSAVPSAHEEVALDEQGNHLYLGYVVEMGPWTIYHSGDTVLWEGLVEELASYSIDIAMLPINGRDPKRGVAGNLSGREAAELAKRISARIVMPCHYEMFEFNTASPQEFAEECRRLEQPFEVLRCGERWSDLSLEVSEDEEVGGRLPRDRGRHSSEDEDLE